MKVTHFETITRRIPGYASGFGRRNAKTVAETLCEHTVSPRKVTKDWPHVTCKLCLKRKPS